MNNAPFSPSQPDPILPAETSSGWRKNLLHVFLLGLVLLAGIILRFVGSGWGEYQYLHPDERFLIWVGTDISPVDSLSAYFDTENSSLNPHNRGHGFYVYGTLPMFITRYVVEWKYGHSGFNEMTDMGRQLSALADVLTLLLVYLIARHLYDRRVALLATAFSTFAALQIQQSHFFTMDTFICFFTFLAFYIAVKIAYPRRAPRHEGSSPVLETQPGSRVRLPFLFADPLFWLSILFGLFYGMAVASKLSAALLAAILPLAVAVRLLRLPPAERNAWLPRALGYLVLAGAISVLVFRLAQPYAFSGPGFFGVSPNPKWMANIRELASQGAGDVDMPPSLQWARRPIWYAWQNMVEWGLGLPLGLLAWAGFFFALWRMLKLDWQRHILLWCWTAAYFLWWGTAFNPTMRYLLPVYPSLAIFAAWLIFYWYDRWNGKESPIIEAGKIMEDSSSLPPFIRGVGGILPALLGAFVLAFTIIWAGAFTSIYTRPITRVDASRWIYQNIPGPINLHIRDGETVTNQLLPFPYQYRILPGAPYYTSFAPRVDGALEEIYLPHVKDETLAGEPIYLNLVFSTSGPPDSGIVESTLGTTLLEVTSGGPQTFVEHVVSLAQPLPVALGGLYNITVTDPVISHVVDLCGPVVVQIQTITEPVEQVIQAPVQCTLGPQSPVAFIFLAETDGVISQVRFARAVPQVNEPGPKTLTLNVSLGGQTVLGSASVTGAFEPGPDGRGAGYSFRFDPPLQLTAGQGYTLDLSLQGGSGSLFLQGAAVANEGDWDDGLPVRVDGYDGFGGIYTPGLNFNMYTFDNEEKRDRFLNILSSADYLLISSNRQWGSLPRLPERFPFTTVYYRELIGCPAEQTIFECYATAVPGKYQGRLGFDLVQVFQSDPQLGPWKVNDQFAEEAFTVYEHPKVLIFKKSPNFDISAAQQAFAAVDLSKVVHITPKKAGPFPADLMLPADRLAEQRQGGTWSDIFNPQSLINRSQFVGVLTWYLALSLLGLLAYPIVRIAFAGLPDHGYPLVRTAGLLIMAYLAWLAGSLRIPFERFTLVVILVLMALLGAALAYYQRRELRQEVKERWRYYLLIESLALLFFVLCLLVRLGNPDLWHPWKGGEKPMDFSYFNAVLKSTSFPPYDPWLAGGYLNYYYFGFVLFAAPVKWLGIVPSFAYNLILPAAFSMMAMGAFSASWNLTAHRSSSPSFREGGVGEANSGVGNSPFFAGIASALVMSVLGNLGTLRMIWLGYQRLGDPALVDPTLKVSLLHRFSAAFSGFLALIKGASLPYGLGDWYWFPSRMVPPGDDAIMEFPAFTFTYADPHAHLFALPIALLCVGWVIAIVLNRSGWRSYLQAGLSLLLGALAIGALRPTNTWDYPTYLALGVVALAYGLWRNLPFSSTLSTREQEGSSSLPSPLDKGGMRGDFPSSPPPSGEEGVGVPGSARYANSGARVAPLPSWLLRLLTIAASILTLVVLSQLLYLPYTQWYGQGYSEVMDWVGPRTPLSVYFSHWGVFLFVIVFWLAWETIDWMAKTPVSALRRIDWPTVWVLVVLLLVLILALSINLPNVDRSEGGFLGKIPLPVGYGSIVALVALPLAAWAGLLLLRRDQPDFKRVVLFLVGTALVISLMVELVVLRGDIGRMNTVFKLYLQAWTLLSVAAGAAFAWILTAQEGWRFGWRFTWQVGLALLVGAAALFPLLSVTAKVKDRMVVNTNGSVVPFTLDGMDYMQYATYDESGYLMDLSQDYDAIRWMQDNVQGSPVIVEANSGRLYRWYTRFTINTGLPGVVGWEWHQQQQRALTPPDWVSRRLREIDIFYQGIDPALARQFLDKYDVRYIIVGQLEKATYPGPGLEKFPAFDGQYWKSVYQDRDTTIYEVIR